MVEKVKQHGSTRSVRQSVRFASKVAPEAGGSRLHPPWYNAVHAPHPPRTVPYFDILVGVLQLDGDHEHVSVRRTFDVLRTDNMII